MLFRILEILAFILPAILPTMGLRLGILSIYLIAHFLGLQKRYIQYKRKHSKST